MLRSITPEQGDTGPDENRYWVLFPPRYMLVGLTGRNAAGKTTVVEWFRDRGFLTGSCSDSIRTWLSENNTEPTRENLINGGRELRRRHGPGILAEMLLEAFGDRNAIIDSIRTPDEVHALRKRGDFVLIEVTADPEIRWLRAKERARPGDPVTKEAFIESENLELVSKDTSGQSLIATSALADHTVENNGDIDELAKRLEGLFPSI